MIYQVVEDSARSPRWALVFSQTPEQATQLFSALGYKPGMAYEYEIEDFFRNNPLGLSEEALKSVQKDLTKFRIGESFVTKEDYQLM